MRVRMSSMRTRVHSRQQSQPNKDFRTRDNRIEEVNPIWVDNVEKVRDRTRERTNRAFEGRKRLNSAHR